MKRFLMMIVGLFALLAAGLASAETVAGLPLHVEKYETGAIRVWVGDHVSTTSIVAFPTTKGVVVVDNTGIPDLDRELREVIARELDRDDFAVLINTHEHGDHTNGNMVYADCEIVGHDLLAEGMKSNLEWRDRSLEWRRERAEEIVGELAAMDPGAEGYAALKENKIFNELNLAALEKNEKPTYPTKTFADRMTLEMGDTKVEMYYIGGMHSSSDIAILVPKHGLLMTGDTMADVWLTETAGCLASFVARDGVTHDFPLLLKNWHTLQERHDDYDVLLPGHWNGTLSYEGFAKRVDYVETMWAAAQEASKDEATLEDFMAANQFAERFPELVDSPGCSAGNHYTTMIEMYSETTGMESAAATLYGLIDEGAKEKKIKKVVAQFGADDADYFFMENQINGYGYRFVHYEKWDEAVQLFRINVALYPDSWNVYDSLGEALYAKGELAEAEAMYVKSVELNPESPTGEEALRNIRQDMSVN